MDYVMHGDTVVAVVQDATGAVQGASRHWTKVIHKRRSFYEVPWVTTYWVVSPEIAERIERGSPPEFLPGYQVSIDNEGWVWCSPLGQGSIGTAWRYAPKDADEEPEDVT